MKISAEADANARAVHAILTAPQGGDGRSVWKFFRLANGDLIFGCYPTGDTYELVTQHPEYRSEV